MDKHSSGRRTFLQKMIALGAAGVPIAAASRPGPVHSADATGGSRMKTAYDPAATFELKVSEVELRRAPGGRMLMARIYQPQGAGPFPTLLDLHGGAWNRKDRFAEEPMDRAVAASGVLVVAIDMTLAPEAPYPAVCRTRTTACAGSNRKRPGGMATRRRSAYTAAPAAATSPSC